MWMLNVKVLKYFDRICAILLSCRYRLENFPECSYYIVHDKLIFLCDYKPSFLILFSEQPTVDPFGNRNVFFME